nr:poly(ADP-ribose) glycohydrolase-like [Lytechinus pictus]
MMPKKRDRETDETTPKRFRQSTLDFHFTSKGGVKSNPEEDEEEAMMSAEERAEMQRRRDLMAAAAERRKQAGSPWSTPPGSPENEEDNDSNRMQRSSTSKTVQPSSPDIPSRTVPKSNMIAALSEASDASLQERTSIPKQEKDVYKRTDRYDYVVEKGVLPDEMDRPSTSKDGYKSKVTGKNGEDEDDMDRSDVNYAEMEPASPTLEYMYDGDGSQPLFTDSEPLEDEEVHCTDVPTSFWKGSPISELNRAPACSDVLPEMRPSQDHTILFRTPVKSGVVPTAFPSDYQDKWDGDHVRMPCSPENLYPVEDQAGRKKVQSRWELIEATLLGGIKNSVDLEEAILTYNARYSQRWNFRALHTLFTDVLDAEETTYFFDKILPEMVNLALRLPKLCTQAIPLLRRQLTHSITISQQQIASLLANAFFCTFPRRNAQQKKSEYSKFPDINFNRLFEMGKGYKKHRKFEKLKCILIYFRRVTENVPTATVTISRRALTDLPRWDKSTAPLTRLHMAASGMIEKEGHGMLQMDFANKYIGGGALGFGCVQEEIRFMINPELIVTRLITEVLDDNECVIIKGAEQFSDYTGYANTFKWKGSFKDSTPRDAWGRRETEIVAIDALVIRRYEDQFRPDCLRRELNKAYCGFHGNTSSEHLPAIASGNWGCGAFGGDKRVKGLIQMMAAAEAGRDLAYFTFEDKDLCDDMAGMHDFLAAQSVTVGDLWRNLHRYRTDVLRRGAGASKPKLFPYLLQLYTVCDSDTDEYETEAGPPAETKATAGRSYSPNYRAETP